MQTTSAARRAKRAVDLSIAIPVLIVSLPFLAVACGFIWLLDPGPVLFCQLREGRNGKTFLLWKIRTMYLQSAEILSRLLRENELAREEWANHLRLRNDPRVLPVVGNLLRRWSIDELPQLWNVIRGEMSLVGPRPFALDHLENLTRSARRIRNQVAPGLTGLWQVCGRGDTACRSSTPFMSAAGDSHSICGFCCVLCQPSFPAAALIEWCWLLQRAAKRERTACALPS